MGPQWRFTRRSAYAPAAPKCSCVHAGTTCFNVCGQCVKGALRQQVQLPMPPDRMSKQRHLTAGRSYMFVMLSYLSCFVKHPSQHSESSALCGACRNSHTVTWLTTLLLHGTCVADGRALGAAAHRLDTA
eukprot:221475-Chlamydomonas_euryale.AAC.7